MLTYGTLNQADKSRAWRALNPTPGTGIAGPAVTAFADTSAIYTLFNNAQSPPGKILYFDYLKLICTTAPGAGCTSFQVALALDTAARGMGAANLNTQVANSDTDTIGSVAPPINAGTTVAINRFGALTPTAATANRAFVGRTSFKTQATPCITVGDEFIIIANGEEQGFGPLSGTTAARFVMPTGIVSIGPGGLFLVHAWFPGAASGPSFEYEAQYWELS